MRPTSLDRFRVNSPRPAYEANANNVDEESVDCGIRVLKCCNTPRCRQLGTTKSFLIVLILLAIVHGICDKFLTISAQQAALEHDYDTEIIEWLLVSNGIIQGMFAILIAYWGNRIHKITWLCGMIVFQSLTCLLIIFPTLTHSESTTVPSTFNLHSVNLLCDSGKASSLKLGAVELPHASTTLVFLFLLQTGIAYGFIGFYTLGLTYLDDNALAHNAPALIGAALAGRYLGYVLGNILSLFAREVFLGWWFGWAIISPLLLIIAIFIGLFPRRMIQTVVRRAADTIVETATLSSQISLSRYKFLSDISFCSTITRIFRNKVLLLNICATVFIETALINFVLLEESYLQARFLLPTDESGVLNNEWTSRTLAKLIQPFVVALAILIGGLIIAKATPSPRKIVVWNVITAAIICLLFVSYIFIECSHNSIAGAYGNKLSLPYCSRSCVCDSDIRFTPVCPDKGLQTYFSPCHAGCSTDQLINGQRTFGNCSCGIDSDMTLINNGVSMASEGACGYESCQKMWIIFQVLTAFGAVCVGSRLVGKLLISIRSVLPQDTAMSLALELSFVGLIAYVPGKFAYKYIADSTCLFWSPNHFVCFLHSSRDFGNWVNIISAILSLIAFIFEIVLVFWVKNLKLYGYREDENSGAVEMHPIVSTVVTAHEPEVLTQPTQPLLTNHENEEENIQDRSPDDGISHIQTITSDPITTLETQTLPVVKQSLSSRFMASTSKRPITRYSPVYKVPETHIEELNLRLKALNDQDPNEGVAARAILGVDINPSVGSDTEKEAELNIQQLESSVSSLSGLPSGSSAVNSPEAIRNQDKSWRIERHETDF